MSKDNSPNGLEIKTSPRQGFLGGGVSRKLVGIIGGALLLIVLFILYTISQKGHHAPADDSDEQATLQQSGGADAGGLADILGRAPDGAAVTPANRQTPSPAAGNHQDKPAGAADVHRDTPAAPAESEEARRARLAREQEAEQVRLRKAQLFQTALSAKSDVQMNLQDEQSGSGNGAAAGGGSAGNASLADQARQQQAKIAAQAAGSSGGNGAADPNKQGVKMAFAEQEHSNTYLTTGREAPLSPYELKVGTLIPATMISGLNSDLPGQIIASVSQNVWDSATGGTLLIPQGSKLYGTYDSQVAYGQDRILVAWTRVNYPDGTTLELKGMGAIDAAGYAGFADQVDHHYWKIFGNAFVLGMITGVSEAGISDDDDDDTSTAESVNNGVTEQFAETGSTLIERNLDVQPTIVIRNGYRFNIMLNKDVVLEPYQAMEQAD